ncbi:hypothetical protein SLE2022_019150 [Rubroshorea leprosula]
MVMQGDLEIGSLAGATSLYLAPTAPPHGSDDPCIRSETAVSSSIRSSIPMKKVEKKRELMTQTGSVETCFVVEVVVVVRKGGERSSLVISLPLRIGEGLSGKRVLTFYNGSALLSFNILSL